MIDNSSTAAPVSTTTSSSSSSLLSSKTNVQTSHNKTPNKDAIIFILDACPSMFISTAAVTTTTTTTTNTSNDSLSTERSNNNKVSISKNIIEDMVIDMMKQSKTNEIGVLLLHKKETYHHLMKYADRNPCNIKTEEDDPQEVKNEKLNSGIKIDLDDDDDYNYEMYNVNEQTTTIEQKTTNTKYSIFDHITELVPLQRPSIHTLREIRSINTSSHNHQQASSSTSISSTCYDCGGFLNGIILATDILHTKTASKKFNRKIILFTDGQQPIHDIQYQYMDIILESLKDMDCDIDVYGFDFNKNNDKNDVKIKIDDTDVSDHHEISKSRNQDLTMNEIDHNGDTKQIQSMVNFDTTMVKSENQKLIHSLVQYTSGKIHTINSSSMSPSSSITTLTSIRNQKRNEKDEQNKYRKTTLFKNTLNIAPNGLLSIPVRVSAYTKTSRLPSLKAKAVVYDTSVESSTDGCIERTNQKVIMKDALGYDVTSSISKETTHWDVNNPEIEVELKHRTQGYMFGSDVIPVNQYDLEGLKYTIDASSPLIHNVTPFINILGYTSIDAIPMRFWIGPFDMVSPDFNNKVTYENSCKLFSSVAQALYELGKVAICTHVAKKSGNPRICILAPFNESNDEQTSSNKPISHMILVRVPFADDVQNINMLPFDDSIGDQEAVKVCDELIDQFMLPSDVLDVETITNPVIDSFYKTIVDRAIDDKRQDGLIVTRNTSENDKLTTPKELLEKGGNVLKRFREIFPLEKLEHEGAKKKQRIYWNELV